jgi:hypothetical protein
MWYLSWADTRWHSMHPHRTTQGESWAAPLALLQRVAPEHQTRCTASKNWWLSRIDLIHYHYSLCEWQLIAGARRVNEKRRDGGELLSLMNVNWRVSEWVRVSEWGTVTKIKSWRKARGSRRCKMHRGPPSRPPHQPADLGLISILTPQPHTPGEILRMSERLTNELKYRFHI